MGAVCSNVNTVIVCCVDQRAETEAVNLYVNLHSDFQ